VFSVCNQEDLLLKTVTKSRSLEKLFVRMEERKKNRIAQVFAQWNFLDKASVEQKLLERCWELVLISFLKFVPWSHIYSHLMTLEEPC